MIFSDPYPDLRFNIFNYDICFSWIWLCFIKEKKIFNIAIFIC